MWTITDELTNTEFIEFSELFETSSPFAVWKTNELIDNGTPYNELLIDVEAINLLPEQSDALIHVYDIKDNDYTKNGYALLEPTSAEITSEENGMLELTLKHPVDADGKSLYLKGQAMLKVPVRYHDELTYQLFRIYNPKPAMQNAKEVTVRARAAFYDLNDTALVDTRPTRLNGEDAIAHIMQGDYIKEIPQKFEFYSNIRKYATAYYEKTNIVSALLGADNSFVNRWGGQIYRNNYYFSICEPIEGQRSTGIIEYGYNMTSIDVSEDWNDVITNVIAFDNYGNQYKVSNYEMLPKLPHKKAKIITLSYDEEDVEQFRKDVESYLENYKYPLLNIKVKFVNLADLAEYKDFLQLNNFEVGDIVQVRHKDLGIDFKNLKIIKKTYDVLQQKTASMEIGGFRGSFGRSSFMADTISTGTSTADKQFNAIAQELYDTSTRQMSISIAGMQMFAIAELQKRTLNELKGV